MHQNVYCKKVLELNFFLTGDTDYTSLEQSGYLNDGNLFIYIFFSFFFPSAQCAPSLPERMTTYYKGALQNIREVDADTYLQPWLLTVQLTSDFSLSDIFFFK